MTTPTDLIETIESLIARILVLEGEAFGQKLLIRSLVARLNATGVLDQDEWAAHIEAAVGMSERDHPDLPTRTVMRAAAAVMKSAANPGESERSALTLIKGGID